MKTEWLTSSTSASSLESGEHACKTVTRAPASYWFGGVLSRCAVQLAVCLLLIAGPSGFGQTSSPKPTFEVASVKPRTAASGPARLSGPTRFSIANVDLGMLIRMAYGINGYQLVGPNWLSEGRFDVNARMREGTSDSEQKAMLQVLLADRFALRVHEESKEMAGYTLKVDKGGPRIAEVAHSPEEHSTRSIRKGADGYPILPHGMEAPASRNGEMLLAIHREFTMDALAARLEMALQVPVLNRTELARSYDVSLCWALRARSSRAGLSADTAAPFAQDPDSAPGLFDAVRQQLGLRLVPTKTAVRILVVDHALKTPTED